jgi:hypothetical protein
VSNAGTIETLTNSGTISGGNGPLGGVGGAGVSNAQGATIITLSNSGQISGASGDVWSCSNLDGLAIDEVFASNLLTLDVVSSGKGTGLGRMDFLSHGAASSAAPEPSTWAMLALGSLGLGGLSLKRRRAAAS